MTSDGSQPSTNDSQLPCSSYTPLEMELLDSRQINAWLDSISERLEVAKRDFVLLYGERRGLPN